MRRGDAIAKQGELCGVIETRTRGWVSLADKCAGGMCAPPGGEGGGALFV